MSDKKAGQWEVYIIETQSGKLYTGISTDVERRFQEHLSSDKGAKFFNSDQPKQIVFREECTDRSSATSLELEIKKMSRQAKLQLIEKNLAKFCPVLNNTAS